MKLSKLTALVKEYDTNKGFTTSLFGDKSQITTLKKFIAELQSTTNNDIDVALATLISFAHERKLSLDLSPEYLYSDVDDAKIFREWQIQESVYQAIPAMPNLQIDLAFEMPKLTALELQSSQHPGVTKLDFTPIINQASMLPTEASGQSDLFKRCVDLSFFTSTKNASNGILNNPPSDVIAPGESQYNDSIKQVEAAARILTTLHADRNSFFSRLPNELLVKIAAETRNALYHKKASAKAIAYRVICP